MVIITCIVEVSYRSGQCVGVLMHCLFQDQFANAFLHDPNMTFPVTLHRAVSITKRESGASYYFLYSLSLSLFLILCRTL